MVSGALLTLHGAACVYAFLRYRKNAASEGWLAVSFVVILFSVGWTLVTLLASPLLHADFASRWFDDPASTDLLRILKKEVNRDAVVLLVVTACESVFYYFYLKPDAKAGGGPSTAA